MDIIIHSLLGLIIFSDLNWKLIIIFSILPDVLPFIIPYLKYFIHKDIFKRIKKSVKLVWKEKGDVSISEVLGDLPDYANRIYAYTHSLILAALLFLFLFVAYKPISLYILPWIIHILVDIPSHDKKNLPTPFLYPISEFKVNTHPLIMKWFPIANYSLIIIVLITILF
jgi:hypothetical protein